MTDEYMSSQCHSFCFKKTWPAWSQCIVDSDGTQKMINLNGTKDCYNSLCPAFKIGYTTQPCDTQACVCIGTARFSALGLDNVEHEVAITKMVVDAPTELVKIKLKDVNAELVKTEEEEDSDMDAKSTMPVNLPKEPITPFQSFL